MGRRGRLALAAAGAGLVAAAGGLSAAWTVPLPGRLATGDSTIVRWRDGRTMHVFLSADDRWRIGATLDEVDGAYVEALIALEDRRFRLHPGVDPVAVARAAAENAAHGRVVSGASTLTMQLARLLEPRPRTLRSKALEALRALQLEVRLSKRQVLEAYLRFVPMGGNVEGVAAASLAYFGHGPQALNRAEIATLLSVPQAPARRAPGTGDAAALRAARDGVAARLWGKAAASEVGRTDPPRRMRPFPREAPHAAIWLRARHPGRQEIPTTLDRGAQGTVERLVEQARPQLVRQGVHNGAVVVVDPGDASVIALVGNLDWGDDRHSGQVAAFAAPRSSGSLLKPFLLAAALDRGIVLPDHRVADVPRPLGGWTPRNYDGTWEGLVALDDALRRSRNAPFVDLLRQVGVEPFLGTLRQLGARRLDPRPGWYGLGAAIGGVDLTPLDAAELYATLDGRGRHRTLRVLAEGGRAGEAGERVLTPGAAWLVQSALVRDGARWKTGTSYGHKDAWAAGAARGRVAVVWLGNLDRSGSVHLVGADAAGPLLLDVLAATGDPVAPADPGPPEDLVTVHVCELSGRLAGPDCPRSRPALAPARSVASAVCDWHVRVEVDAASGLGVTPACGDRDPGLPAVSRAFVRLPSDVRDTLEAAGSPLLALAPPPPPWAPGCAPDGEAGPPVITSPPDGAALVLIPGLPAEAQEVALRADSAALGPLSWFLDGAFLGRSDPAAEMWWAPVPGDHLVRVIDPAGRASSRRLQVATR